MTVDAFTAARRDAWDELERLVQDARGRPERLGAGGVRRLGELYQSATADLARARRRYPGDPIVARLESLVGRSRHLVYDVAVRRQSLRDFVVNGYWRRVAERPVPLVLAAAMLFGPAVAAAFWALGDPGGAGGLVPDAFRAVTEPRGTRGGLTAGESFRAWSAIFTNNVRVSVLAFAGGIGAGILTAVVLVVNGVILGVVAGLAIGAGNAAPFFELVTAHGVLELSLIVVSGGAGLRLGAAVVDPGHRRRGDAIAAEARATVELLLGTAALLGVAALIEGFITPAQIGVAPAAVVGSGVAVTFWSLVLWRGRSPLRVGRAA